MLLATLGDSLSCGEGVGLRVPLPRTWVGLLAAGLPGAEHLALAAPGARTADLRRDQLPFALDAVPALATVATGLNDVSRAGFDARRTRADLHAVVDALLATGAHVLVTRLHDPTRLLPLPAGLRRAVLDRVAAVNEAVDECVGARVLLLDLAQVPLLDSRCGWAVDRLHPSVQGHAAIAHEAGRVLREGGWYVGTLPAVPTTGTGPGALAEAAWVLRHALPWAAAHGRQVGVPLLALTAGGPVRALAGGLPLHALGAGLPLRALTAGAPLHGPAGHPTSASPADPTPVLPAGDAVSASLAGDSMSVLPAGDPVSASLADDAVSVLPADHQMPASTAADLLPGRTPAVLQVPVRSPSRPGTAPA